MNLRVKISNVIISLIFVVLHFTLKGNIEKNNIRDLIIIGRNNPAAGLGKIGPTIIDMLKNDIEMKFIIANSQHKIEEFADNSRVGFFYEELCLNTVFKENDIYANTYRNLRKNCNVTIAYSMIESSEIPPSYVYVLNHFFDVLVVPDVFLVDVYKKCGVEIPIFVLPIPLFLEKFLIKKQKISSKKPFVFGTTAGFAERKNLVKLLKSFIQEFGDSKEVFLKIHGRYSLKDNELYNKLCKIIQEEKVYNVEISRDEMSLDGYIGFMSSLDCYVLISKGEGFSITPREALALGLPCILSDNTVHGTICQTGLVKVVLSNILVPAYYSYFGGFVGYQFDCEIIDVRKAMREVYENCQEYLDKAQDGRLWVQQYLPQNLKDKFLNLVKPKQVIFGDQNVVTDDFLMTSCPSLYEKYKSIIAT